MKYKFYGLKIQFCSSHILCIVLLLIFSNIIFAQVSDGIAGDIAMGNLKSNYKSKKTFQIVGSKKQLLEIEFYNQAGYLKEFKLFDDFGIIKKHVVVTYKNDSIPVKMEHKIMGVSMYEELKQILETRESMTPNLKHDSLVKQKSYTQTWKFTKVDSMIIAKCEFLNKVIKDTFFRQVHNRTLPMKVIDSLNDGEKNYVVSEYNYNTKDSLKLISTRVSKLGTDQELSVHNVFYSKGTISIQTHEMYYNLDDSISKIVKTFFENGSLSKQTNHFSYAYSKDSTFIVESIETSNERGVIRKSMLEYTLIGQRLYQTIQKPNQKLYESQRPCQTTRYNLNGDVIEFALSDCENNEIIEQYIYEYSN